MSGQPNKALPAADARPVPGETPHARLLRAIASGDHDGFAAALPAAGDLNAAQGALLRAAAHADNTLFMKELALRGADPAYAIEQSERARAGIPRKRIWDDDVEMYFTQYYNLDDDMRDRSLGKEITALQKFHEDFVKNAAPYETLRRQQQILDEITALRQEISEMRDGKPLEKAALHAPVTLAHNQGPKTP